MQVQAEPFATRHILGVQLALTRADLRPNQKSPSLVLGQIDAALLMKLGGVVDELSCVHDTIRS
jgi:hypothetical protein